VINFSSFADELAKIATASWREPDREFLARTRELAPLGAALTGVAVGTPLVRVARAFPDVPLGTKARFVSRYTLPGMAAVGLPLEAWRQIKARSGKAKKKV